MSNASTNSATTDSIKQRDQSIDAAAVAQFRAAIVAAGLTPPDVIQADGKLHRFSSNGKAKDDAGWYVLHGGPIPAGTIGDHRTGLKQNWRVDIGRMLSPAEEAAYRAKVDAMRLIREGEEARRRTGAVKAAAALWAAAEPASFEHPYLVRKAVRPSDSLHQMAASAITSILGYVPKSSGEALTGDVLIAPVFVDDAMTTCELIDGDGRKSAIYGGAKAGGFWPAQPLPDNSEAPVVFIGEGVATMLSVREACDHACIAALSSNNLLPVARAIRKRYPSALLVLVADLVKDTGEPDHHTEQAAQVVSGRLLVPAFGDNRASSDTDINDMAVRLGIDKVRTAVKVMLQGLAAAQNTPQGVDAETTTAPALKAKIKGVGPDFVTCSYGGGTFDVSHRGVFFIGRDKDGNDQPPRWICSPLSVVAKTRDAKSGEWGRLLEWRDDDGVRHQWAMPLELLQSDGTDMRRELARMGLSIATGKVQRDLLASFVQVWPVENRARCVERLGWHSTTCM
jgi:phage/plasmid primase-like uncharacterized protein